MKRKAVQFYMHDFLVTAIQGMFLVAAANSQEEHDFIWKQRFHWAKPGMVETINFRCACFRNMNGPWAEKINQFSQKKTMTSKCCKKSGFQVNVQLVCNFTKYCACHDSTIFASSILRLYCYFTLLFFYSAMSFVYRKILN